MEKLLALFEAAKVLNACDIAHDDARQGVGDQDPLDTDLKLRAAWLRFRVALADLLNK